MYHVVSLAKKHAQVWPFTFHMCFDDFFSAFACCLKASFLSGTISCMKQKAFIDWRDNLLRMEAKWRLLSLLISLIRAFKLSRLLKAKDAQHLVPCLQELARPS
jgi:hypothetical protein